MRVKFLTNDRIPIGNGYYMRYSHNSGSPIFDRVNAKQVMLLANHDSSLDKVLGTVSNAYHDNAASHAEVDFFDMPDDVAISRAKKLVDNGWQGLSAGLLVHGAHVEGKTLEIDSWELIELSLTPIPRHSGTSVEMSHVVLNEGGTSGLVERYWPSKPESSAGSSEMGELTLEVLQKALLDNNQSVLSNVESMINNAIATQLASRPNEKPVDEAEDEKEDERKEERDEEGRPEEVGGGREPATRRQNDFAVLQRMSEIAQQQSRYDKEKVLALQMDGVVEGWDSKAFMEKLESIAIHPSPFAPNSNEREYDLGLALTEMMRGRIKESSYEHSLSDEILNKTMLPVYSQNTLAIPWSVIQMNTQYGGTSGTDSASHAVVTDLLPIIRKDVPDPLDIVPLCTRVPSTPGESRLVYIEVPEPDMVPEPGDGGYDKTGDSYTSQREMTPKIQVDKVLITRLAGVTVPTLMTAILNIGLQKMNEKMNKQILVGTGANNVIGAYNFTGIESSSEMTALSTVTAGVITKGLDLSYQFTPSAKRIIVHPEVRTNFRTIARPTAVGEFFVNGQVDGTPVLVTKKMQLTPTTGLYRGMIGPWSDCYLKQWDDAVFVSSRYEDGNQILVLESFWDSVLAHPELWYRILDDA